MQFLILFPTLGTQFNRSARKQMHSAMSSYMGTYTTSGTKLTYVLQYVAKVPIKMVGDKFLHHDTAPQQTNIPPVFH